MDLDDLQPRKKLPDIVLGEDISALSAHELEQRIARLEADLRDYRHLVNGSLDEPWAYFVRQVAGLDRLRARAEASFMNAYLSSRAESAASRNRIFIRAGYKRAWEDMTEDEREAEANAGWAALYSQARGLA